MRADLLQPHSSASEGARQLNKVCIVGYRNLAIQDPRRGCRIGGHEFAKGEFLALDENSGDVHGGELEVIAAKPIAYLAAIPRGVKHRYDRLAREADPGSPRAATPGKPGSIRETP